jgi:glycosyltransferase involved in cell wall biosynthesis
MRTTTAEIPQFERNHTRRAVSGSGAQVLQVVLSLAPGGTERLVIELSRRLHDRHGMAVCCLDEPGLWAEELRQQGIAVTVLGRRPGFSPRLGGQIAAVAARHRAAVLHCHQYSPFIYGSLAGLGRPLRVVFTEHGRLSDAPSSAKRRVANWLFGRLNCDVFAVSQDLKRSMVAEGFQARRIRVIWNGIDPGPGPRASDRISARERLGVRREDFLIGSVGRLDPVKDLLTLVAAFREAASSIPAARLVIVGDGSERAALETAIDRLGLQGRIMLTGVRSDVRQLLPAFDVYVNCSIFEGISLTILEAMASGLPVVATGVGGTPEIVDSATGILVPPRNAARISDALRQLATASDVARSLGAAGRRRVEDSFSMDRMVREYSAVYDQMEVH